MGRVDAQINKETLAFIFTQIGVTSNFLAQKLGVSENKIEDWVGPDNNTYPTINQAKTLAKILKVPFAGLYMRKDNLPIKQLPPYRNLRSIASTKYNDESLINIAIAEIIKYHDFLLETESSLEIQTSERSLPMIKDKESIFDWATIICAFFELDISVQFKLSTFRKFYLYIREKIENKGIFVHCFTGVDVEEVRGIAIYSESKAIIGINDNDSYPAKTFSMIHELVHILKRQSTICNEMFSSFTARKEEIFCNAVAGEVLVPKSNLVTAIKGIEDLNLEHILFLAKKFCVSKEVIARRLHDLGWISKTDYVEFINEIHENFMKDRERSKNSKEEGNVKQYYPNMSRIAYDKTSITISKALLIGYADGYFSKQEVSGVLGVREKHISKFFAEVVR